MRPAPKPGKIQRTWRGSEHESEDRYEQSPSGAEEATEYDARGNFTRETLPAMREMMNSMPMTCA
jgi:hypothetical protein